MRRTLLIVIICLVVVQLSCARKKFAANANAADGGAAAMTIEESRLQAHVYLEKGKELYRTDQDTEAMEAFQRAIKLDPELAEAYFRLGLSYDALEDKKEAEDAYKKAVESYKKYFAVEENDNDAEAHYNLGQTYAALHLYSEAAREYRQATRLRPDDADIYYDLGIALTRLAQYDEAVATLSKSLAVDPENYRAEDALKEAREGVDRIRAGKKHQEELIKKQKEEELKEAGATPETSPPKPAKP
jgi:tetratricopeptide (TPR) repeat protein